MKLSHRSYPHPVVGNADDVLEAAYQATVEMTSDKENIYLSTKTLCSSTTLSKLIKSGDATFVVHVECSNTLYRQAHEFTTPEYQFQIPRNELNDDVEVNTFIRALKDMPTYRIDGAHPDYGSATFDVKAGDVLAVGEGYVFTIESNFDSMSRIGSIFKLQPSSEDGDQPMRMNPNGDKLIVILSKPDIKVYNDLKYQAHLLPMLASVLVLPILTEALHLLQEAGGEEDSRRWVRVLTRKLKELGLENKPDEELITAQKLLELPIRRAFSVANLKEKKD
jgi:hypothetical protein